MPRPQKDESVRPRPVSVSLTPQHKATLDRVAKELNTDRSAVIHRFVDMLDAGGITALQLAEASLHRLRQQP